MDRLAERSDAHVVIVPNPTRSLRCAKEGDVVTDAHPRPHIATAYAPRGESHVAADRLGAEETRIVTPVVEAVIPRILSEEGGEKRITRCQCRGLIPLLTTDEGMPIDAYVGPHLTQSNSS